MSVEPDLVPDLHIFYGANVNCSIKGVFHHLHQGMCFGLSMFMKKVRTLCIHGHWGLPLT